MIIGSVDVQLTLSWRHAAGGDDTVLAQWVKHWEPLPGSRYDAQAYDVDEAAPAIDYAAGDQLVFRYTAMNTTTSEAFIPNGDGPNANGRIPQITLPR
ncbi:MAG TPA: hypothetical protein VGC42_21880 [Kofleriaceae bacterium]